MANSGKKTKEEIRDDFLVKMYEVFWSNISRAEDTAWKMMAAYTALFAGLSLATQYISMFGFLSIVTVFSFLAVAISLNANLWFVRNIGIISSIEKETLLDSDFGKIIPKRWVEGKLPFFSWTSIEIWWVLVPVFIIVPVITIAVSYQLLNSCQKIATDALFIICLILTTLYGISLRRRHHKYVNEVSAKVEVNHISQKTKKE